MQIVDGQLPPNYNKLDVDVTSGSLVDVVEKDLGEEDDEKECECLADNEEISNNHRVLKDSNQNEEQAALPKREKWMISKVEEGRLNSHKPGNTTFVTEGVYRKMPPEKTLGVQVFTWKRTLNPDHDIFVFGYVTGQISIQVKKI